MDRLAAAYHLPSPKESDFPHTPRKCSDPPAKSTIHHLVPIALRTGCPHGGSAQDARAPGAPGAAR